MADDLADFPIVILENDYPEAIGKVGLFDYLMPVGSTGIVFTAAVPGRLQEWGPVFSDEVKRVSNVRAAATLIQMGLIRGETFAFLRQALQLSQSDVATMYGITLGTVIAWETNTIPVPRAYWGCLATRVCVLDGIAMYNDFALPPPNFRPRLIRVFPIMPTPNAPQPDSPHCPMPTYPCMPDPC